MSSNEISIKEITKEELLDNINRLERILFDKINYYKTKNFSNTGSASLISELQKKNEVLEAELSEIKNKYYTLKESTLKEVDETISSLEEILKN